MLTAGDLKHRFQIREQVTSPSKKLEGGLANSYVTISKAWGELIPVSDGAIVAALRGNNIEDVVTHVVRFRWISIKFLGKAFTGGFSFGFKGMSDLNPLKKNYYLFKEEGSAVRGRLFRISGMMRDEKYKDYIKVRVIEMEEQGTGYGGIDG